MYEVYDNNQWVARQPVQGERFRCIKNGKVDYESYWNETNSTIRIITTGSMQRRFTIPEEVFIASDAAATVIKSRLLNASFCNLDFQDTVDGVDYICDILLAGNVIADKAARKAELLQDGTVEERY